MQIEDIRVDAEGRELTEHGIPLFPTSLYTNQMARFATKRVPWHWHQECEIVHLLEGELFIEYEAGPTILHPGDAAFVNGDVLHAMHSPDPEKCCMNNIVFHPAVIGGGASTIFTSKYIAPVLGNHCLQVLLFENSNAETAPAISLVARLENCLASSDSFLEMRARSILSELWICVIERSDATLQPQKKADPYIRTLLIYLHEHYDEPLSLADLAASAGISTRTCNRSFQTQLGLSPFECLLEYRIERAAMQLTETELPVADIGMLCGFPDPSYFSRTFRKLTGSPPAAYRVLSRKRQISSAGS